MSKLETCTPEPVSEHSPEAPGKVIPIRPVNEFAGFEPYPAGKKSSLAAFYRPVVLIWILLVVVFWFASRSEAVNNVQSADSAPLSSN